jgi:2-haloacid dehalogenase
LIDWNPRYMYRKLFAGDEAAMEHFLASVCTQSWNEEQDAGRTFAKGCAILKKAHPEQSELIDAWFPRCEEMFGGPIAGSVAILSELRARKVPLYALSKLVNRDLSRRPAALQLLALVSGSLFVGRGEALKAPTYGSFSFCWRSTQSTPSAWCTSMTTSTTLRPRESWGCMASTFTGPLRYAVS